MREEAKLGVVHPRLVKYREQHSQNARAQRVEKAKYGFPDDERRCKAPDGTTGNACNKRRDPRFSRNGLTFCSTCFANAYPDDHAKVLSGCRKRKAELRSARATRTCVGLEPNGGAKDCPNPINANGIAEALQRAGLTAPAARAAMQAPGVLQLAVAAYVRSAQCLKCFLFAHPTHAKTLKESTQCTFEGDASGSRCRRTAQKKGLCATHQPPTHPSTSKKPARPLPLPCRDSACTSGQPRVSRKRGLCQPCLDAFDRIVKAQAAEFPPVEPPCKRQRR